MRVSDCIRCGRLLFVARTSCERHQSLAYLIAPALGCTTFDMMQEAVQYGNGGSVTENLARPQRLSSGVASGLTKGRERCFERTPRPIRRILPDESPNAYPCPPSYPRKTWCNSSDLKSSEASAAAFEGMSRAFKTDRFTRCSEK